MNVTVKINYYSAALVLVIIQFTTYRVISSTEEPYFISFNYTIRYADNYKKS